MNKIVLTLVKFYQKYLTILSFGSCRYYPTCSSYTKMQFEHNSFFKALLYSCLRILRCNPLFDGGFDYPQTRCRSKGRLHFKRIQVKYWKVPVSNNQCLIVKHNNKWDK